MKKIRIIFSLFLLLMISGCSFSKCVGVPGPKGCIGTIVPISFSEWFFETFVLPILVIVGIIIIAGIYHHIKGD